ncbi:MAG: hypothetical protein M2R45_01330 [Verrucomicrobia subdivision 3 bacterium]|nr:hypothetical protein [Limisphaerales bacterium]MCS1415196.1 hypothetical protein [Limisphaerales bacterium]
MNVWKVILAAFILYVAGIVTGTFVAGYRAKVPKPEMQMPSPPHTRDIMRRMESRLDLTDEQREQVNTILQASQDRMRSLMHEVKPQLEAESKTMREQIEALLSEEQMEKFDKVFRHRGMRPRHDPGERGPRGGMRGNGRRSFPQRGDSERPQRPEWDFPLAEKAETTSNPSQGNN